jgi:hypothetical protein
MWIEISNTVLKQLRLILKIISVSELSPLMKKYGMQQIIQDLVLRFGKKVNLKAKSQRIVYR